MTAPSKLEIDRAVREAGFATEPYRHLLDRAAFVMRYLVWPPSPVAEKWLEDYRELSKEEQEV